MKSFAFLKEPPLAFALRILALVIILSIVGINFVLLPDQVRHLRQAYFLDIHFEESESKDYAVVTWVSPEAQAMGISVGNIILNPQAYHEGEIGAPMTFFIISGDAPVREVTLIPRANNSPGYLFSMLGLSSRAVTYIQIIFLLASLTFTGLFSVVAFLHRSDAWLVLLTTMAFSHLCGLVSGSPQFYYFLLFSPSVLIFFLILFPTGKFVPRWSWVLVFLPLPNNISFVLIKLGIAEHYANFPSGMLGGYSTIIFLVVLWGILYEYRNKFTLFKRWWMNWLFFGLVLTNIPRMPSLLFLLGIPRQIAYGVTLSEVLRSAPFAFSVYRMFLEFGPIAVLTVLGVVLYRYYSVFKPRERQQMKWLVFGLIWSVGLLVVLYMFNVYYLGSSQHDKAAYLASVFDKVFVLAAEVIVLSVLLAIFSYDLYDVDLFINRALVYSGLMIIAGGICLLSTIFVDSVFGKSGETFVNPIWGRPDEQADTLTLVISIVFLVITFNPVRRWLQKIVDERFKSSDFDFAESFYEFTPEMRAFFTMPELSKMLVTKSVEQFGVTYASVYLKNQKGKLERIETEPVEKKGVKTAIDSQTLSKLEEGELVFPGVDSPYSLIIPLVLSRGRKFDFVGALVLGPRSDGLRYSAGMLKKMKSFGREIGKVLYTARIQDQSHRFLDRKSISKPVLNK